MVDPGRKLISRILMRQDITEALDKGITPSLFLDEAARDAFGWIYEFYRKYGAVPSLDLFEQEFPDFRLPQAKEPVAYYADLVIQDYIRKKSEDVLIQDAPKLLSDPEAGLDSLLSNLQRLINVARPSEDVISTEVIEDRIKQYEQLKTKRGIDGYPYKWDSINDLTGGAHAEELITIAARPGVGKTFFMVILLSHFWELGLRPMFVTKEMSTTQIMRRFDAVHFKLPYREFRSGMLSEGMEKRYIRGLQEMKKKHPFYLIGQEVMTFSSLRGKIEKYRPDIVLLDGLYLMHDEHNARTGWERVTNLSRGAKELAQKYKIPLIVSTQLSREGDLARRGGGELTLSSIGYSDAIGQDSDVVFALVRTTDMKLNNEMKVLPLKVREGEDTPVLLGWDLTTMEFPDLTASQVRFDPEEDQEDLTF